MSVVTTRVGKIVTFSVKAVPTEPREIFVRAEVNPEGSPKIRLAGRAIHDGGKRQTAKLCSSFTVGIEWRDDHGGLTIRVSDRCRQQWSSAEGAIKFSNDLERMSVAAVRLDPVSLQITASQHTKPFQDLLDIHLAPKSSCLRPVPPKTYQRRAPQP